jgi:hypothetical protein
MWPNPFFVVINAVPKNVGYLCNLKNVKVKKIAQGDEKVAQNVPSPTHFLP